jgi:hypothetical protein
MSFPLEECSRLPSLRAPEPSAYLRTAHVACWTSIARSLPESHDGHPLMLCVPKCCVPPIQLEQRLVCPLFDNDTRIQHHDMIGIHDGRKPVRNHERGAVKRNLPETLHDLPLRTSIQR